MNNTASAISEFDLLYPALQAGFKDVLNPYNAATVLVFLIILSIWARKPLNIVLVGGVFIFTIGCAYFTSVFGYWDGLYLNEPFTSLIYIIYLLLGGAFILLGILEIMDRVRFKRESRIERFRLRLPCFFREDQGMKSRGRLISIILGIGSILLTFFIAQFIGVLAASFPQDEYIYVVYSFLLSGGNKGFVLRTFLLYCLVLIMPLIIAWIVVYFCSKKCKGNLRAVLIYKTVLSALYIATGVGLGCFISAVQSA